MNPLLLIGIGVGALWLIDLAGKAAGASSLNFVITNAQVKQSGLSSIIVLTINIQNPSNSGYTIKSIVGNFFINNNLTGNVSSFSAIDVPPNSEVPVQLNVLLQPGAVISDIINLFSGSNAVNLRLVGTANAGLSIPFDIQFSLV